MSFEDEWAQHKQAADAQAVSMRLNQTPDGDYRPGRLSPADPPDGKAGIRIQATRLIDSSWGMLTLRDLAYDTLDALVTELGTQSGMAGDDDAGAAFATAYKKAASTLVDQLDFASLVLSNGSGALLDAAEKFLKSEDKTARRLLEATESPYNGVSPQPSRPDCSPRPSRSGAELPEVTGETGNVDRFVKGDRYRGDPGKLRAIAEKWYTARGLLADVFYSARERWHGANLDHEGLTADAIESFFKKFVGKVDPPDEVSQDEALLANLPAACFMLAKACEAYANHIESSREQAAKDRDPFMGNPKPLIDAPMFGGNGEDGGLHGKVSGDAAITRLADVAPALDRAQSRVRVPQPDGGPGLPGVPGLLPLPRIPFPARVPTLVPVAAYGAPKPGVPHRPPIGPPNPPDPRFPTLGPQDQGAFRTWLQSLEQGDITGGHGTPAEAYQKRVSGYPEYKVPIPPGISEGNSLMVDGLRRADGMAVEAKYVGNSKNCYRTLDALRREHAVRKRPFLFKDDRVEMSKYSAALRDPRNSALRGVEVATNHRDSVPYWRVMMAAYGVKGYARHVP